ncbi:hypothetical protein B1A99_03175 [Cohnella sp. CIP 111063]|uniref:WecB/TagA/CpsF family glycosyltransferase n=1 Tax=unclassified Cohnella TaxID=2636738 RepID=UPI000B8C3D97|nr:MULTISPECIES: WecB/TagA/CpsF family glycosyltransferase [unclassified Cohnella]OXS61633.1 hypothetical protein B1A99_03175 [Cohnella sp. CIP 111063]PRX74051.1 exopolysaccharide biosynthesis WecB/TagA/CpsF family protein [Cohnella sp. SGD-V74]
MSALRIALVHNYYQQSGGEDKVVEQERDLLNEMGHEVVVYQRHNDSISTMTRMAKLGATFGTIWSWSSYRDMRAFIRSNKPDIVHFHNTFPLISPSAYYAAKKEGIPVIQTLHNYRLLCPGGALFRKSEVCERCIDQSLIHAVRLGCYRSSRLQSAVVAVMLAFNRWIGTWNRKVDRYIVLTEFAKQKFVKSGFPEERIWVKPNFRSSHRNTSTPDNKAEFFLYVGRLSAEKGIKQLVQTWMLLEEDKKLVIVGDGPDEQELKQIAKGKANIAFLGKRDSSSVMRHMAEARFLITPSVCYEGFPMAIIEAYSVGTPVICNQIGSLQEIVKEGVTGFHYNVNDAQDLMRVIRRTEDEAVYRELTNNVKQTFFSKYTKDMNSVNLMQLYEQVLKHPDEISETSSLLKSGYVLESRVTALKFQETVSLIEKWIADEEKKYVCVCTTHSLVTATQREDFKQALHGAGICTPDGMPLVWALKALGFADQDRVDGTSLMMELCRLSAIKGYRVYLYGCTPQTLETITKKLEFEYPGIHIVGAASPPFRTLTEEEESIYLQQINDTRPDLVFVALGCPKQEVWMYRNRNQVKGIMLGVGAAFDYVAGNITRPPAFVQKWGFEWLFRLLMEPRRLWKRYFYNNSAFIYKYLKSFNLNYAKTKNPRMESEPR